MQRQMETLIPACEVLLVLKVTVKSALNGETLVFFFRLVQKSNKLFASLKGDVSFSQNHQEMSLL